MRQMNMPPSSYNAGPILADPDRSPWATPSTNPWESASVGSFGAVAPQPAETGFSWGQPAQPAENPWASFGQTAETPQADMWGGQQPELQATQERRETLRSRVGNTLGKLATVVTDRLGKAKDMFRGRDVRGTFGAGGQVDRGLATARGYADKADSIANGKAARAASHIPVVGGYVKAAREVAGTVKAVSGMSEQYGDMAGRAESAWDGRGDLAAQAAGRGREAAKDIARGGTSAALGELGLGFEDGKLRVQSKRKLGKRAFQLATGVGVAKIGGDLLRAGAQGARSAAEQQAAQARGDVQSAFGW